MHCTSPIILNCRCICLLHRLCCSAIHTGLNTSLTLQGTQGERSSDSAQMHTPTAALCLAALANPVGPGATAVPFWPLVNSNKLADLSSVLLFLGGKKDVMLLWEL